MYNDTKKESMYIRLHRQNMIKLTFLISTKHFLVTNLMNEFKSINI